MYIGDIIIDNSNNTLVIQNIFERDGSTLVTVASVTTGSTATVHMTTIEALGYQRVMASCSEEIQKVKTRKLFNYTVTILEK